MFSNLLKKSQSTPANPWFVYLILTSIIFGSVLTSMSTTVNFYNFSLAIYFVCRYFYFSSFAFVFFNKEKIQLATLCLDAVVLTATGLHLGNPYLYHLALVPAVYGHFFSANNKTLLLKSLLPVWGMSSTMAIYQAVFKKSIFAKTELLLFSLFCGSLAIFAVMKYRQRLNALTRTAQGQEESAFAFKDKHFFHDVLNQTHGINLFLSRKVREGMNVEEVKLLQKEMETLQQIVGKHSGLKRMVKDDSIHLHDALDCFSHWLETYLVAHKTQCHLEMTDYFKQVLYSREISVNNHVFSRIMVNLIKNIHDYQSKSASFHFDINESHELIFKFSNNLHAVASESEENLDNVLKQMILSSSKTNNGLGLSGVEHLLTEAGGKFSYQIEEHQFVVIGSLPVEKSEMKQIKKVA